MRCPKCEHNHKYRDGMVCSNCSYHFIINPKIDGINDYKIQKQVERANVQGTVYFTRNQLYAAYCSKFKKSYLKYGIVAALVIMPLLIAFADPGLVMTVGFALFIIILTLMPAKPLPSNSFFGAFEKWLAAIKGRGGADFGLLEQPYLHHLPEASQETDIYDYGVEAIIVTDQDIYVDLFVKNAYHTQFKALIISKNIYPAYLRPQLENVLAEKPDLPIFFIHDATMQGIKTMETFLAIEGLATAGHPCIDLGLLPKHFQILNPLKRFAKKITDDYAPLDLLQHKHFVAVFNKYIVECAENQALLSDDEILVSDIAGDLSNDMMLVDFAADDFG